MIKKAFIFFSISLFLSIFYLVLNPRFNQNINEESFNDFDVTIYRDRFGVPHIIGKKDIHLSVDIHIYRREIINIYIYIYIITT